MIIKNARIVLSEKVVNGWISFNDDGIINSINEGKCLDKDAIDAKNNILLPGFIDIHIHGSNGIDFMDASEADYKLIANSLYQEGVTTFLATTLTSDKDSLKKVCQTVANIKKEVPSLGGIHFEGPYINEKYKGAQNPEFIRKPNIKEFDELQKESKNNIRYISLAPENAGAIDFIKHVTKKGVTVSAGHTDATYAQMMDAIEAGLSNTTHTHNAMSGHHHRNPGVVTAALADKRLFTEFICDKIHVCPDCLQASYKIVGPDRFIVITDALKVKHTEVEKFDLFGLPCLRKDGAAYLTSGPLAGSLLTLDQGLRNIREICNCSIIELSKITSRNAAKSLHFNDRGEIAVGKIADFVLLDKDLQVVSTFKLGKKVF